MKVRGGGGQHRLQCRDVFPNEVRLGRNFKDFQNTPLLLYAGNEIEFQTELTGSHNTLVMELE